MDCKQLSRVFVLAVLGLAASAAVAREPRELMWDDMIPEDDLDDQLYIPEIDGPLPPGQDEDPLSVWGFSTAPVLELDGQYVKLPGFIVPLDSDEGGRLDEFLLVPYFGACIHVPPPPPNQIVYVRLKKPYEIANIWEPYWIIGTMKTQPYDSELASSVYQMTGERLEKYDY